MIPKTKEFKKELPRHLANRDVIENITRATMLTVKKRNKSVAEIPQWEEMRRQAHQIKREMIDNLEENLCEFEKNAAAKGVTVLRAKDGAEANTLAEEIARKHDAKRIVKAKSMLTEEIGFNDYMIGKGFEVVETDLGEYILQLAGESPSHLIGPAMHKSRFDIAKLFSEKLGIAYSDDPKILTETARKILREKFLNADIGVTGANFGIIENGAIVVVENEGNARMCLTLPKVHIAFIGMERLIPAVENLALFLTLLCRSANGQKMTSYISMLSGPRLPQAYDGPEKSYYIIVDNGRSTFLADEHLKQALYCIRCSACYNVCPVYQNIGGHAYGWVYQGPIGAVITPQLLGLKNAPDLPFASSLCGSCTDVCPVKIPLHHLLLYQRNRIIKTVYRPATEKAAVSGFVLAAGSAFRFGKLGQWGAWLQRMLDGLLRVPGWSKSRELPLLAKKSFRRWWKENVRDKGRLR